MLVKADPGAMMIVTGNLAISAQSKWIRGLLSGREREAEHSAHVIALLDRADELRSERNEFAHGIWDTNGCEPKTALIQTVNLERTEVIRTRLVTVADLNELVIEINEWIADYIKLGRELGFPRRPGETKSMFADRIERQLHCRISGFAPFKRLKKAASVGDFRLSGAISFLR
jgi:hypothetical protein